MMIEHQLLQRLQHDSRGNSSLISQKRQHNWQDCATYKYYLTLLENVSYKFFVLLNLGSNAAHTGENNFYTLSIFIIDR